MYKKKHTLKIKNFIAITSILITIIIYIHKVNATKEIRINDKIDKIDCEMDQKIYTVRKEILTNLKEINNKIDTQNNIFRNDIKEILKIEFAKKR